MDVENKLKEIGTRVRKWAVKNRLPSFGQYLNGMCAIASAKLLEEIRSEGLEAKLACANQSHVFVESYGYIVDVTATQFGDYDPVFVTNNKPGEYWDNVKYFDSVEEFNKLEGHQWPVEQQPKCF
jgi:hypothetical protein